MAMTREKQILLRLRAFLEGRTADRPFTPPAPDYKGTPQQAVACGILHGTGRMEAYHEILQWLDQEEATPDE